MEDQNIPRIIISSVGMDNHYRAVLSLDSPANNGKSDQNFMLVSTLADRIADAISSSGLGNPEEDECRVFFVGKLCDAVDIEYVPHLTKMLKASSYEQWVVCFGFSNAYLNQININLGRGLSHLVPIALISNEKAQIIEPLSYCDHDLFDPVAKNLEKIIKEIY